MIKKIALISIIALLTFACEKQTFVVNKNIKHAQMPENSTFKGTDHQFFWGLASDSNHKPLEMCEGGVDMIGTQKTFVNGLLGVITYGIYTPRTYQVQCSK